MDIGYAVTSMKKIYREGMIVMIKFPGKILILERQVDNILPRQLAIVNMCMKTVSTYAKTCPRKFM
jgi:hypothetical protein